MKVLTILVHADYFLYSLESMKVLTVLVHVHAGYVFSIA